MRKGQKMPKEIYEIEINRPVGVTVAELKEYIQDAVRSWGSQFPSDYPLLIVHMRRSIGKVSRQKKDES